MTLFTFLFLVVNSQSRQNLNNLSYLLIAPLIIDGVSQYLNWRENTNLLRLTTGILSGLGISILIISIANKYKLFMI